MKFVYKPEGIEPRSWDFKPEKLLNPEAEAIERHTGWTFGEWVGKLGDTSMLALHGLLYVLLKRSSPTLKWDEVQFSLDEIGLEADDDEAPALRAHLEEKAATEGLSVEEQATLDKLLEQGVELPKA